MLQSGHEEILIKALLLLDDNKSLSLRYFLGIKQKIPNVSLRNTLFGLRYPDTPCGKYIFENGKLIMKKSLCTYLKLLDDIVITPNMFSKSYSSHKGYFSIWHAMTYNPNESRDILLNEIIEHIMSMCKLAIWDDTISPPGPNSFWLGFALHTIMDSYSPSHTQRSIFQRSQSPLRYTKEEDIDLKVIQDIKDGVKRIENRNNQRELDRTSDDVIKRYNISEKKKQQSINKLAKFFLFHKQAINHYRSIKEDLKKSMFKEVISDPYQDPIYRKHVSKTSNKPILSVYYYQSQNSIVHSFNDMIHKVKEYDLYDICIIDCYVILRLYKEALLKLKDLEFKNSNEEISIIYSFLRQVYKYLSNSTFASPTSI